MALKHMPIQFYCLPVPMAWNKFWSKFDLIKDSLFDDQSFKENEVGWGNKSFYVRFHINSVWDKSLQQKHYVKAIVLVAWVPERLCGGEAPANLCGMCGMST